MTAFASQLLALAGQPTTKFPPAADARGVITQRLPRGWVPSGRVIDVQMEVQ